MADVQSACLVVGAVGQRRNFAPASSSRHPGFYVEFTVCARTKFLGWHIQDADR